MILDLRNNQLDNISDEIYYLQSLTQLKLDNNKLTRFTH